MTGKALPAREKSLFFSVSFLSIRLGRLFVAIKGAHVVVLPWLVDCINPRKSMASEERAHRRVLAEPGSQPPPASQQEESVN